jgi:sodium-dependent dicarboxylate transporter 2/3/5
LVLFGQRSNDDIVAPNAIREQYASLGRTSREEWIVLGHFCTLAMLWLTRRDLNLGPLVLPGWGGLLPTGGLLNDGVVAILIAVSLFVFPARRSPSGRLMDGDAILDLPWHIVLLFGGGFALAQGFVTSGLSGWFGQQLAGLSVLPPLALVLGICLLITFLTELTSNTATAEMFLPILAALAVAIEVHPLLLMIPGALSCSFAFMLPVATPPNAIVFGTGRVTASDMARTGIWLNLLGAVVITVAVYLLGPSLGIDLGHFPAWAGPLIP